MTKPFRSAAVADGVDLDAVRAAVRGCLGVDDLDGGPIGSVVSYFPGRQLPGLRVEVDRVTVQVRAQWGVPVGEISAEIRNAVAALVAGRHIDIIISDIITPAEATGAPRTYPRR